ncbi:MAG: Fic family protein [Blastocatellales bacterium]|nr:Fic family protein [Blastocatellales bacterium]
MELPIFQDNLRSSAGWTADLAVARERWQNALTDADARAHALPRLRRLQLDHAQKRSAQISDSGASDRFHRAAELVTSSAAGAPSANLGASQLHAIYRALTGSEEAAPLRRLEGARLAVAHDPAPAVLLPRLLDNAFEWFSTESFAEIHPVEQAALVHLRLTDLQPYPDFSETIPMLAASFYTERAGLPPVIIFADEASEARYAAALAAAFRMLTQPLVELIAENLARTSAAVLDAGG